MVPTTSPMSRIPEFWLYCNDADYVDIKWKDPAFPYDVGWYLLDCIGRPRFEAKLISQYTRDIYILLSDVCQRGLLWRLRNAWVCQPYIWDELGYPDLSDGDFVFNE